MKFSILLSIMLFFFLIAPAGAVEEVTQTHIKTFDIPTTQDLSISGLEMYDLDPNSNTSFVFNSYGKLYYLNVTSSKSWGWWDFDLSLTNPNGTVETKHLQTLAPAALDWDFYLQYYFVGTDTVFDLDVYAALLPLSANLSTPNPTLSDVMQFSNVACNSSSYFDTKLYLTTQEEFEKQKEQAISLQLQEAASDVFSWSWNTLLSFIEKIPLVGGHISAILVLTTMTISSIIFYTKLLFIDYSETTFLTIEFFILSYSFTKKGTFWSQIKRVVDTHVKLIEIIISTAQAAVNLFSSIVQMVTSIVNSLKPV